VNRDENVAIPIFIPTTIALAAALLSFGTVTHADETLPAFPGAVGQGAAATGGRGGDVYRVTNLDDYNSFEDEEKIEGSLRHGIRSATGPRTIVFDVGGVIKLVAPLDILKDDLTIAGQTAPGPGITLWGYPVKVSRGSNIIIRYLRLRLGDFNIRAAQENPEEADQFLILASVGNGLSVTGDADRVILDHLSVCWGIDETLSVTNATNVTVQNCIIAESLNDSYHPKGPHGYGSLIRGQVTAEEQKAGVGGYTFYGNLWAHHRARNPSIGGEQHLDGGRTEEERRRTDLNLINNVIYNWYDQATHRSDHGEVRINMIGNAYLCGPEKQTRRVFKAEAPGKTLVYQEGNYLDSNRKDSYDQKVIETPSEIAASFHDFDEDDQLINPDDGSPFNFLHGCVPAITSASEALGQVLQGVGASLTRDAIDQRIIHSVKERSGRIIDSQEEHRTEEGILPGIDDVSAVYRPEGFDSDGDGMSDEFERLHGLDPSDATDGNSFDLSDEGYTNLEVYLDWILTQARQERKRLE